MATPSESKTALILYLKYPQPGKVKTRLAADTSPGFAANIYRLFVEDLILKLGEINCDLILSFPEESQQKQLEDWLGPIWAFQIQKGQTLGDKLSNSFEEAFQKYEQVAIMGSDSPDLPITVILEAINDLKKKNIVIGPTADGGYYLIGCKKSAFTPSLFENISWSTATVLEETLAVCNRLNHHPGLLETWYDVDYLVDLVTLYDRSKGSSFALSKTMRYLKNSAEFMRYRKKLPTLET